MKRRIRATVAALGVALIAGSAAAQRVSQLPQASSPYSGTETFSFSQAGKTVKDTFGNFRSFVIGTLFPPIYPACTGVANDDAVLKAAITAAQGTANALVLTGFCVVSSTIPVTAGITIRGSGALKSGIVTTATTGDVLAVQTPDQVDFEDFGVQVNGANWGTSGAAISLNGASGGGVNNYNGKSYLSNIYIRGTYDGLRLDNASDLRTVGLYIEDTTHDNVLKVNAQNPDAGQDHHIGPTWRNLNRGSTPNAGFEYLSGGDIQIVGGKIIGQKYGVLINSTYGPTGTVEISSVSFEENSVARIAALQAVSGIEVGNLVISGNQFSNITSGAGRILTIGTGTPTTAAKWIRNITFTGNLSNDFSTFAGDSSISILDGDSINIGANALNNNGTAGPTAIRISTNATNVTCGLNQISNYPTGTYFDANTTSVCTTSGLPNVLSLNGTTLPTPAAGALLLGGAAAAPTLGANGEGAAYLSSAGGLLLQGRGSTDDLRLLNKNGQTVANVPTGTTSLNVVGLLDQGAAPTGASGSGYVRASSPAFTNLPTAPTQAANDNSTKLATTAYVDRQVLFDGHLTSNQSVTSTYTVVNITADTDTGNYYSAGTHRFTPLIAGTYAIFGSVEFFGTDAASSTNTMIISKNGLNATIAAAGNGDCAIITAASCGGTVAHGIVSMNGSSDTLELDGLNNLTSAQAFVGGTGKTTRLTIWRIGP